eukprot:2312157-Pleurochrysis_carterae.AAC.3
MQSAVSVHRASARNGRLALARAGVSARKRGRALAGVWPTAIRETFSAGPPQAPAKKEGGRERHAARKTHYATKTVKQLCRSARKALVVMSKLGWHVRAKPQISTCTSCSINSAAIAPRPHSAREPFTHSDPRAGSLQSVAASTVVISRVTIAQLK